MRLKGERGLAPAKFKRKISCYLFFLHTADNLVRQSWQEDEGRKESWQN